MLDGLTDVVSIQKPDHGIVRYNQAGYQALNMTPEEVAGKKCYQLIGRDKPCEECATTMALAQKQVVTIEKYVPELGVHMLCTSNPILDENNRVTLIIEQLRDITEQKEAERELIRTNQRLEQALAFAKDMARQAEAANTAKSEFLANMSHEIRTPMNGVIGMTDLLLQSELDDNQRLYAETVRSSAESLLALINDILDFSKIEAAQLELETIDFQLRPALEDLTDMIALKADQKGLEFICGVHPDVPDRLQGDPGRLRQILTNLCGNAVKFTDRGEVAVQVSVAERLENRVTLRFEVHDTGIGIPTGKIDDLFEAFQQMDASTTRRFGGTGLGLTISKRLVEMMNGEIGVESEEGRGSTFWFTADFVPLAETTARTPRKMIDIQGARMLVVDDNATNRRVLFLMLESWGVRPETASDGPSALDMLRRAAADEDPFLVAVLDMQMPDMDGIQLGEAIKADPEIEETRLVMMTSMSRRGDARRLEEIGFDAYLTKPVKQSQLHDCLAALVSGQPHFQGHPEPQPIITRHVIRESRHANGRVLLVEDNPTNQKVALKILENLGFYADLADNGLEALKALRTASYQLVLMDVQMPEMDGLEAARAIRSGQARVPDPQVPIIALTAHAMKGDREKCLAAGMDDYLPKPFKTQELAEILNRFLGGTESDTSHPSSVTEPESESSTETTFDYHELVDMLSGDVETAAEMADVFAQDTALHLEGFRLAVESRDVQALKHFCHKIKGSAGMIHARALAETAAEAEVAAAEEDWDRALDLHSRLTDELVRFQDELRKLGLADGQD
jgi:signal transduction histidine kinase/CheY-like chemotaxis protein/HPt (histidine-containing phosphotransfer) domain-containing protein